MVVWSFTLRDGSGIQPSESIQDHKSECQLREYYLFIPQGLVRQIAPPQGPDYIVSAGGAYQAHHFLQSSGAPLVSELITAE